MFDFLFSLIGFVFRNFFLIVGIGVLISILHKILTNSKKDAMMHKLPALVMLFGFLLHSYLYWTQTDDLNLLVYAARCVIPGFVAWFAGGLMHELKPGAVRELIALAITYLVAYLLSVIFEGWIVSVITLVVGVVLAGYVMSNLGKQYVMDYETNDPFGDSEEVQRLYREGYRPSDYYDTGKKGQKTRDNLRRHGVDDA